MHILAGGGGAEARASALQRLARLMLNIEHGARVYEWGPGSGSEADPAPAGFLEIAVEGVTLGAPPVVAAYRPTVGVVFLCPAPGFDATEVVRALRELLAREGEGHLLGELTVEVAPHAEVRHRGRIYPMTEEVELRRAPHQARGWAPTARYPSRHLYCGSARGPEEPLPPHFSVRAAFTWVFLPAAAALRLERGIDGMAAFNALAASILFDPLRLPEEEPAAPLYAGVAEHLGVPPLPPEVAQAQREAPPAPPPFLIYVEGSSGCGVPREPHFEVAAAELAPYLPAWGAETPLPTWGGSFGSLALGESQACSACGLPLWGSFVAVSDPALAPKRAPVCRWCFGCAAPAFCSGPGTNAGCVAAVHPRGGREAFSSPEHALLGQLVGQPVRRLVLRARGAPVYLVGAGAGAWLLDPLSHSLAADPFLCLRHPDLAGIRARCAGYSPVLELRGGGAPTRPGSPHAAVSVPEQRERGAAGVRRRPAGPGAAP
jgi:hypothetical protein